LKILVIGSGGREHALVWRLAQSPQVEKLWCAPGNGGIAEQAECVAADVRDVNALAALARELQPDLTVVGPEDPLVAGIRDRFERDGLRLLGPSRHDARLEGSKVFSKQFMERHKIPTAASYGVFDTLAGAMAALDAVNWPVVIKADGLCAGKGVLVAETREEAEAFLRRLLEKRELGAGGARVLLEQALRGDELSYIVLTDGRRVLPMAPTRDHKRALDGDRGPNTGGMGTYTADGMISTELEAAILDRIVRPTIAGLSDNSSQPELPYTGFLFFGLMLTADGPMVLEYNCRMGDPEAQAMVARMDFDLAAALEAAASGRLGEFRASWKSGASVCVVMASGGYPGAYETGKPIDGLADAGKLPGVAVFHAGTKRQGGTIVTSGGRVVGVTAAGPSLDLAIRQAYQGVHKIHFSGAQYRTDIAAKGLGKVYAAGETGRG